MTTIVQNIENGESVTSVIPKLKAMIDAKIDSGASDSVSTLGDIRTLLNVGAPTEYQISNGELGLTARTKINEWHNDAERISSQVTWNSSTDTYTKNH
jgi:hypothetical protein